MNANLISKSYYPFGMLMPGRHEQENSYEYGFNGMRKDDEIKGTSGSSYDFGARIYDPRVGRWLSVDPLEEQYVSLSPYCFAANSVLKIIDPNGREIIIVGKDEDFTKFKETLEAKFEGMIEFSRDEMNRLVMNVKENSVNSGMTDEQWNKKAADYMDNAAYEELAVMIGDPKSATIEICDKSPNFFGGGFRGGTYEDFQILDVGDAHARIGWKEADGAGVIVHEIVEGYNDQVVRGKLPIENDDELANEFFISHTKALQVQAKMNGFEKQFNQGKISSQYGYLSQVFSMRHDVNGEEIWTLTEFYAKTNNKMTPKLIREQISIKNVVMSEDKSKVVSYEEAD